ncbi:hypothetical protein [Bosea sp. RAC05]|uniref:hypothetical protein n=1 Tax=Bosea sp. RAC05 TaxID=1842539 RepID=UPI00083D8DE4|nr:hypothetical protein [Bosea sp. RAC05]AOG03463.1 hypothetical protein BSY19_4781 [Bosea sp. RAC05]
MTNIDEFLIVQADAFFGKLQSQRGYSLPAILSVTTAFFALCIALSTLRVVGDFGLSGSLPVAFIAAGFLTWSCFVFVLMWRVRLKPLIRDARSAWTPKLARYYAVLAELSRQDRMRRTCRLMFLAFVVVDAVSMVLRLDPNPTSLATSIGLTMSLYADCTWPRDPGTAEPKAEFSPAT